MGIWWYCAHQGSNRGFTNIACSQWLTDNIDETLHGQRSLIHTHTHTHSNWHTEYFKRKFKTDVHLTIIFVRACGIHYLSLNQPLFHRPHNIHLPEDDVILGGSARWSFIATAHNVTTTLSRDSHIFQLYIYSLFHIIKSNFDVVLEYCVLTINAQRTISLYCICRELSRWISHLHWLSSLQ